MTLGTNPNYDVTKTDAPLTVNKAVATVVADAKSKFYGDGEPALDGGGDRAGDWRRYGRLHAGDYGDADRGVGTYPITVTLGSNPNYGVTTTRRGADGEQGGGTMVADPPRASSRCSEPGLLRELSDPFVNGDKNGGGVNRNAGVLHDHQPPASEPRRQTYDVTPGGLTSVELHHHVYGKRS